MTPSQWLAIARDIAILGALIFLIWWVRTDGQNSVKIHDFQALQKQVQENAQHAAQYAQQAQAADQQRANDLAKVSAAIGQQRAPIVVLRGPANPGPVSCAAPSPSSGSASAGGNISGTGADSGTDVRPAINVYEQRVEGIVADCRAALAKWPTR